MIRFTWLVLCVFGALTCGVASAADDKKGIEVDLDGLKSRTPATWKEEKPANKMRFLQFSLPAVKGDKEDAELVIFKGFGGSAKDNVNRWKMQFIAPEGKRIDDVATVTDLKVGTANLTYLDVQGTYLFKAKPIDPDSKAEKRPDYRMLGIHFEGPKDVYHIKLVGPAKTVESFKKGFDEWVKAFK